MPENIRALIVVLVLAVPAFYISRRIAGSMIAHREFAVWRNAWFAVTIAGFLSGNFFAFAAVVAMVCLYAHSVRGATVALFIILLFAMPSAEVQISIFGAVNRLIGLNNERLLAVVLLLPILFATARFGRRKGGVSAMPDRLIVGYVLLSIALEVRIANVTSIMRGATEAILDILIPYFAMSRAVTSMADFRKVLLAFVVAVLPLSLIAVLETVKGWPLYNSIFQNWGAVASSVGREGLLRASASAGPIALGFIIMVAIGCMLAVQQTMVASRRFARIAMVILAAGLIAALSRGPWVGVAVLVFIFVITGPNAMGKLALYVMSGAIALTLLLLTPFGQRLIDFLPFIGSIDSGSVTYRQQLFENAIPVIERNLWFGSEDYLSTPEMQKMVQGQQIIDIVNSYLGIALEFGLVGLGLFLAFFASILLSLRRVLKFRGVLNIEFSIYVRASIAILIAILVTIGTVSSVSFIPNVYWSFAGLCVALTRIAYRERVALRRTTLANLAPR